MADISQLLNTRGMPVEITTRKEIRFKGRLDDKLKPVENVQEAYLLETVGITFEYDQRGGAVFREEEANPCGYAIRIGTIRDGECYDELIPLRITNRKDEEQLDIFISTIRSGENVIYHS